MAKPQYENLIVSLKAGVLEVALNRPKVLNSFNAALGSELLRGLTEARTNTAVRALLLRAEGKAFCAGQDLSEIRTGDPSQPPDLGELLLHRYNPLIRAMVELDKPIVCAVQGTAAGAGMSLALACDFVIAGASAYFISSFSNVGLVPDSGLSFVLPRIIGQVRARAVTMLGEKIQADEAVRMGLIYKAVPDEALLENSRAVAAQLANRATSALGLTKRALRLSATQSFNEHLELEAELQRHAGLSEDFHEGVTAFREKRNPTFRGR